jgi:hypothetical protein
MLDPKDDRKKPPIALRDVYNSKEMLLEAVVDDVSQKDVTRLFIRMFM